MWLVHEIINNRYYNCFIYMYINNTNSQKNVLFHCYCFFLLWHWCNHSINNNIGCTPSKYEECNSYVYFPLSLLIYGIGSNATKP